MIGSPFDPFWPADNKGAATCGAPDTEFPDAALVRPEARAIKVQLIQRFVENGDLLLIQVPGIRPCPGLVRHHVQNPVTALFG